jgi:hypothetical protein
MTSEVQTPLFFLKAQVVSKELREILVAFSTSENEGILVPV